MRAKTKKLFYWQSAFILLCAFFLSGSAALDLFRSSGYGETARYWTAETLTVIGEVFALLTIIVNVIVGVPLLFGKTELPPWTSGILMAVTTCGVVAASPYAHRLLDVSPSALELLVGYGIGAGVAILTMLAIKLLPTAKAEF